MHCRWMDCSPLTRAAFGLGVGLLMAERLNRPARQATAIALVSLGTLAVIPLLVKMALETDQPARIRTRHATGACARSAGDSGYGAEHDIY